MKSKLVAFGIVCVSALIGCGSGGERVAGPGGIPIPGQDSSGNPNPPLARDTTGVPLSDLGAMNYKGFAGGLYPDRAAVMSADHASVGTARGRGIVPLDVNGTPKSNGKIVLLSIGMSNTADEFCGGDKTTGCDATTFIPIAAADGSVNHSTLVIVNGAQGGEDADTWDTPSEKTYDIVRDERLRPLSVSEKQVEVVWLKQANARPSATLPSADADAYRLETFLGGIVRSLKTRYPNVKQVFVSSRTYGGYATSNLNPEPYAYETGFAVKWLVQAQIDQMRLGQILDTRAGDLDYNGVAPWVAWGPYLWANGTTPRSDGLTWVRSDFRTDGTHPSSSGEQKVSNVLLSFFKSSPQTKCWFVVGGVCG